MPRIIPFLPRLFCILALSVLLAIPASAQNGITIGGGTLYTEWPADLAAMPCVITIVTEAAQVQRRPSQVVLLIDASTGMEGMPLQMAREAAQSVLGKLADDDLLGLVTFAGVSNIQSAMQPLAAANRQNVTAGFGRIMTQPGRDLSAGLRSAAGQFALFSRQDAGARLIVLITNGAPDHGLVESGPLLALADSVCSSTGAAITTVGYDRHIDEATLIAIAEHSGGRALFVEEENAGDIPAMVGREISRFTASRGGDARLILRLPEPCRISDVHGARAVGEELLLPPLPDGDTLRIFFDISPMPESRRDIEADLSYADPATNSRQNIHALVDFPLPQGSANLNNETATLLSAYVQRRALSEKGPAIEADRRAVSIALDDTLKALEQESVRYNGRLDAVIVPLRVIQKDLANNTVDTDIMIKRLQYEPLRIIYGF